MKPLKPDALKQVEYIKDLLRKGQSRKDILQPFTNLYKTGIKTFDNRLKLAQKAIQDEQANIQTIAEGNVAKKVEALESKIMSVVERQLFLSELVKKPTKVMKVGNMHMMVNEIMVDGKSVIEILPTEIKIKALAELNKMDGSYAATKTDLTSGGSPIKSIVIDRASHTKRK